MEGGVGAVSDRAYASLRRAVALALALVLALTWY